MRKPTKAAAVVLVAVLGATTSPAAASAAPKEGKGKPVSSTCTGKISADGLGDPYLFGTPLFAGRGLMGFLVVPDNGKVTVDAVADSWSGMYHNTPGSRDALRLETAGLTYRSNWTNEVLPLDGVEAWIGNWEMTQTDKWTKCAASLPVIPFSPIS